MHAVGRHSKAARSGLCPSPTLIQAGADHHGSDSSKLEVRYASQGWLMHASRIMPLGMLSAGRLVPARAACLTAVAAKHAAGR